MSLGRFFSLGIIRCNQIGFSRTESIRKSNKGAALLFTEVKQDESVN